MKKAQVMRQIAARKKEWHRSRADLTIREKFKILEKLRKSDSFFAKVKHSR